MCRSLVWETYKLISVQDLSNVTTGIFVQLLVIAEDNHRDVDRAEHRELMRLLEEASLALEKSSWLTRQQCRPRVRGVARRAARRRGRDLH